MSRVTITPGVQYGRWTVLEYVGVRNENRIVRCRCTCGTIRDVIFRTLLCGRSASCGCIAAEKAIARRTTEVGRRYGRWCVTKELPSRRTTKGNFLVRYVTAECQCGTVRDVILSTLKSRASVSCGCFKEEFKHARSTHVPGRRYGKLVLLSLRHVDGGYAPWGTFKCDCGRVLEKRVPAARSLRSCGCTSHFDGRSMFTAYRHGAKQRGYAFDLTREEFDAIASNTCSYCGAPPTVRYQYGTKKPVNGLDRVDNKQGYVVGNCVACCEFCNRAKGTKSATAFRDWLAAVVARAVAREATVAAPTTSL